MLLPVKAEGSHSFEMVGQVHQDSRNNKVFSSFMETNFRVEERE